MARGFLSVHPHQAVPAPVGQCHNYVTAQTGNDRHGTAARRAGLRGAAGWVVLAAVLAAGSGAAAQQGQRAGGVTVDRVGGYLEFVARDRWYDQNSKTGAGDTDARETIFEENIRLELDGSVYHPNLLEYSLAGLFGLVQSEFEETFGDRRSQSQDDGDVIEYDAEAKIFQRKSYPGTLYARQYRSIEPRAFQPSLEVTTQTYGGTWQWIDEKAPTSLQFSHTEVDLQPTSGDEEPGSFENTQLRFDTGYRFSPKNSVSLSYRFESQMERPFELDYDIHELTLGHVLLFGDFSQHRLDSELNLLNQKGTFDIDRFRWRETMRLQHAEDLRSWYVFELLDREQGNLAGVTPIEERSYLVTGTLEHQLYDSLISQVYGFVHDQNFMDDLEIRRWGGQGSLDYRKENPWGRLLSSYRARFVRDDRTGGNQQVDVLDERGTFRDPEPVTLANSNVITGTILITAEDRVTTYQPSRDYRVRQVGDRVELERVPGGRIADGQTVLIDYVYEIAGDFKLDTIDQTFAIRQQFDIGLEPYYRFRKQDQSVTPEDATGVIPEDIIDHIVGVEFQRGVLDAQAEYESYDSSITPQRAIRLNGGLTKRFESGAVAGIQARWSRIDKLPPDDRETRFFSVEGRYRHPVTKALFVEAMLLYRNENDSLTGRDDGLDLDVSVEWSVRETDVLVTYEYGRFDDDFTDNENSTLFVQVRRRF